MERKSRKKNKETGRWTREEHTRFIQGLIDHGKNWKKVEEVVRTRTAAQVRSHAQKFFNRLSKTQTNLLIPQQENYSGQFTNSEQNKGVQKLKSINQVNDASSSEQDSSDDEQPVPEQDPPHLVGFIKKQSNDGKDRVGVKRLINVLHSQSESLTNNILQKKSSSQCVYTLNQIAQMERSNNHIVNLSKLLVAYIVLSESEESEDESFFLTVLRKHRKFIYNNRFFNLVDIPTREEKSAGSRKRSFSEVEQPQCVLEGLNSLKKMALTEENKQQEQRQELGVSELQGESDIRSQIK